MDTKPRKVKVKLLGIIVNKIGSWKNHLHGDEDNLGLLKDLSKRIGMLKQLRRNIPTVKFKMLTSGLFTSKLIYGLSAWGTVWGSRGMYQEIPQNSINLKKDDMRKLQVLQNSSMRLLLRKKYDTPTSSLLEESKSLSVNQTVAMSMMNQVWKIKRSQQPVYHYERLFGRLDDPASSTRSITSQNPSINFSLSQGRGSFFYLASNLWNCLPIGIRMASTNKHFKTSVKTWIKTNVPMKA